MKYWPLTFVLLAVWIGGETGAQDAKGKVVKFDTIEAERILVRQDVAIGVPGKGKWVHIQKDSMACYGDQPAANIPQSGAGISSVGVFVRSEKSTSMLDSDSVSFRSKEKWSSLDLDRLTLSAIDSKAITILERTLLQFTDDNDTMRFAIQAYGKGGPAIALYDAARKERLRIGAEADRGASVTLLDAAGKVRAQLGASTMTHTKTDAKTDAKKKYPESTLTLLDAKGNVLVQLPK
jgi:hypothetical protein